MMPTEFSAMIARLEKLLTESRQKAYPIIETRTHIVNLRTTDTPYILVAANRRRVSLVFQVTAGDGGAASSDPLVVSYGQPPRRNGTDMQVNVAAGPVVVFPAPTDSVYIAPTTAGLAGVRGIIIEGVIPAWTKDF